ncbi:heme o synthase [Chlorogloeopsis fritschii PCC 9212]|uniref:Protoheme IX farnesyltransferase n=1 Tax=Chlorogloeopsis fritschii PCC 6912 TaxID=211165 RepID=A0A433MZG3_CHLFR|nr:heme o synthase [Chlorogloeopsis fritschii]RUR73908.1 protoheme IX farnesyltransferase [Chlorogloeopsis fritschii PCC 6912]
MIGNTVTRRYQNFLEIVQSYYQLTKPRIIPLLLITTTASMSIASRGKLDLILLLFTLAGGTFAAASAQTFNCVYDRDIDYEMERTRHRPLPSGRVQPTHALIFAIALACISFTLLAAFVNLLSAVLAMSGILFYVGVYTHLLKRHTSLNIVIGGAAGAIPTLVGWAAVTDSVSWTAWLLFAIVFLWTPPHFWALALMISEDYAKVGVPMLPVVADNITAARQIWVYTLLLIPSTFLLLEPLNVMGAIYGSTTFILGAIFIKKAWALLHNSEDKQLARSLFLYSILYMMLLCAAMVIDSFPITHKLIEVILGFLVSR